MAPLAGQAADTGGVKRAHEVRCTDRKGRYSSKGRVDQQDELAGVRGLRARVLGPVELGREMAAGQRGAEQFNHHGNERALVTAEGHQRAAAEDGGRIGRGLAIAVDAHAGCQSCPCARRS